MRNKGLSAIYLALALTITPWHMHAEGLQSVAATNGAASDEESLYADGTRAINESRWHDAVGSFNRVAQMHGEHAEGALYWKAYAENKEGQPANALNTCGELRKKYPRSRWLNECGALEIEIRGKSGDPVSPQAEPDENLKLLAINALMQQDQAQAVPILQKILSGNQSEELKSRALFVLAQSDSPQAQELIRQIAQGQSGQALQIKAIRMLATGQGKRANDTLASIYQHSNDAQVKRVILQSYLITGDSSKLLEAARQETNPELVKTAIQTLGRDERDAGSADDVSRHEQCGDEIGHHPRADCQRPRRRHHLSKIADSEQNVGLAAQCDSQPGNCRRNVGRADSGHDLPEEFGRGNEARRRAGAVPRE